MTETLVEPRPAESVDDLRRTIDRLAENGGPQRFRLRARLPAQGRTDTPLAATKRFSVVLKTYASGGENALHAHPNEDHAFIVLQGRARFSGADGELGTLGRNEGMMLPRGALYRFESVDEEPLVLLRIGSAVAEGLDPLARTGPDGAFMDPFSAENKQVELVFREGDVFE